LNVRLFEEDGQRWKKSVSDQKLEVLCISQFTLYHELKGNKPDFHNSMAPQQAREFYNKFLDALRKKYTSDLIKGMYQMHQKYYNHYDISYRWQVWRIYASGDSK
jgi:D-aminoacyl-tRNA deacylase